MSEVFPFAAEAAQHPELPLAGLKVLDLSRLLPGPYASLLLADMGADVLKVEDPQFGDYLRWRWPFASPAANDIGAIFLLLNRNKRSLTLNLKSATGQEIFKQLVLEADIVLESFRPGVMTRLGLGYEQLRQINPRLIYGAISGYGQDGPYKNRVGHDLNYIGYAGLLGQTGRAGEAPTIPGIQIADLAGGGLFSLVGMLAAIEGRHHTGQGRLVDMAMTDGVAGLMIYQAAALFNGEDLPARGEGQLNGGLSEYNLYRTADDKYLTVGALEPKFFSRLCTILGMPEYDEVNASPAKVAQVKEMLAERFATKTRAEWLELLADDEVCVGPAYELAEIFNDPQLASRSLLVEAEQPRVGKVKQMGLPLKFDGLDPQAIVRQPAPAFGEHTTDIIQALGYTDMQVAELKSNGVI
jgi:crotonobetainyl-CoA:carnitine CoA-transferase CaiB-like acyl-CoA transferase